jgi:hypothetical protein
MTYRIRGLDPAPFQTLFAMSDEQLEKLIEEASKKE